MMEAVVDPVLSETIGEDDEDGENEEPETSEAKDALRAAFRTFRPVIRKMTTRERARTCEQIASRMQSIGTRRIGDRGAVVSMAYGRKGQKDLSDLGKRIMAARNANYRK